MADVKPSTDAPRSQKGAGVGPDLSPTGANEREDGIIKAKAPEGPGEDQIGLVGGNPKESLQSTPNLPDEPKKPEPKAEPKAESKK